MTLLNIPTLRLADFTLMESGMLVSEASTLQFHGVHRIYDDACDEGIAIEGRSVERFVLSERKIDADGDIQYWDFAPIRTVARVKGVRIYND